MPSIDLYSPASRPCSSSPPPGRPEGLSGKRGRDSPGSQSDQKQSKAAKKEGYGDRAEYWSDMVKNANLVSEESTISPTKDGEGLKKKIDFGHIASVQGTPAKPPHDLEYVPSPVLSRTLKN